MSSTSNETHPWRQSPGIRRAAPALVASLALAALAACPDALAQTHSRAPGAMTAASAQASAAAPASASAPRAGAAPAPATTASGTSSAARHGRPGGPAAATGCGSASAKTEDCATLPRLVAIATPENDDAIVRFALYAARDIEQLGLQFPAKSESGLPDAEVVITMRLRDGATARMRDFSRAHLNEPMILIVDGVEMLTAVIGSELGGRFQLHVPKEKARLLFQRVLAKAGPAT